MMKRMIKTAAAFLAVVFLVPMAAAAPETEARCCIVMDADSGRVLYEKNADCRSLIASTTKIMTCLVALEHCQLEKEVLVPPQAVGIEGSSLYLKADEQVTMAELLYGLMLHSGNDAAMAIAMLCAGSVEEFVALMNLKAQKLGLENTHFENPSGLDGEDHYSTARDLGKLTAAAMKTPGFLEIVSTRTITLGSRSFSNHNRLLNSLEGCIGVKTGYTKAAGRVLVSACQRQNRRLIAVTIDDGNDWEDHRALYEFGFACYKLSPVVTEGTILCQMPLMDGTSVPLAAAEDLSLPMLEGESVQMCLIYPRFAFVAGPEGEFAALAGVRIGGRRVETIRLNWGTAEEFYGRTTSENTFGPCHCLPPGSGATDPCG